MATTSPLAEQHHAAQAGTLVYGSGADNTPSVEVVATFGELELEYAAIRKSCALLDLPQRGVIELTGGERIDFLNRMLTQELKNLPPYSSRRAFWLNRKGRIDADLRVVHLPSRTLLDVDVLAVQRTIEGLSAYIITEDVEIRDATAATHRFSLHGPTSLTLLAEISHPGDAAAPAISTLSHGQACVVTIADQEVVIARDDSAGEIGLELTMPVAAAAAVYGALTEHGIDPGGEQAQALRDPATADALGARVRLRPAGWMAYNIARIEAGSPIYNIDFGPDSLPAESGVINDRVSFTKGCYLGQEIVARMHARGHPKQTLVALRLADSGPRLSAPDNPDISLPAIPHTGAHVFAASQDAEAPPAVGVVTSSAISMMLGARAVCFAQVKWDYATSQTTLNVDTEGSLVPAAVQPSLAFWKKA